MRQPALHEIRSLIEDGQIQAALRAARAFIGSGEAKSAEIESCARLLASVDGTTPEEFPIVKIAVLGGYTTGPLVSAIRCGLISEGFVARIYESEFDSYRQEILNPGSGLYAFAPEMVLIALGAENLRFAPSSWADAAVERESLDAQMQEIELHWKTLSERLSCKILQHTIVPTPLNWTGPAEKGLAGSPARYVEQLNNRLWESFSAPVYGLDVARLAAQVGGWNWRDDRLYCHGKFEFHPRHLPEYMHLFLGSFRALTGRTRKALVLDLDQTLWGGTVGEDGWQGIELGPETPAGEAHAAFCRYVRQLKDRGVVLAVCSKNDPEPPRTVFEHHPHMPLRLQDFAVFCCNWQDKAANLRNIAQELNLDPSSLVFVDNDPAECDWVRRLLPTVSVVCLPEDPAAYVRCLDGRRYFDAVRLSEEDRKRAASYQGRAQANKLKTSAADFESYLRDLDMRGELFLAAPEDIPRLAQMELKTNQFNLTTRRYSEERLKAFFESPDHRVWACRLSDRFADHGLVSSVVTVREVDALRIDSWLMSCRVFSRGLEAFILNGLVAAAREMGLRRIVGEHRPTPANAKFAGLYGGFGFRLDKTGTEASRWSMQIDNWRALNSAIHNASRARSEAVL